MFGRAPLHKIYRPSSLCPTGLMCKERPISAHLNSSHSHTGPACWLSSTSLSTIPVLPPFSRVCPEGRSWHPSWRRRCCGARPVPTPPGPPVAPPGPHPPAPPAAPTPAVPPPLSNFFNGFKYFIYLFLCLIIIA